MLTIFGKEFYLYNELKEHALKAGIPDKSIYIGVWLKLQGYEKKRIMRYGERKVYYYK